VVRRRDQMVHRHRSRPARVRLRSRQGRRPTQFILVDLPDRIWSIGPQRARGLFAYLQLLGAANILELKQANADQQAKLARYRGRLGTSYQLCVGLLMLGVVISTVSWLGGVWPTARDLGGTPLSVERVDPGGAQFVVRRQGGSTEILTAAADGTLSWLPIDRPNIDHPR